MTTQQTRIDILRHGLPEGDGCLRGHTDFPITPTGLTQMATAIADLESVDVVITSSLQRCSDFAQLTANKHSVPLHQLDSWKEMDFGNWDGQLQKTLWQEHNEVLTRYWQNPWLETPHGGEALVDFDKRIHQAWLDLVEQHKGKKILLVSHSGVMRQLMRILLEMPENASYLHRIQLPYAARYRVTIFHDEQGTDWPQIQWPTQQQF